MTKELGAGIRAAREARGYSLRAVASTVGISPSLLSQVETGKTEPSVSTLWAVATYLEASIDELMGQVPSPSPASVSSSAGAGAPIQRSADNPTIEMENGVTWERLAVGGFDLVDPLITTYAPGGASSVEGALMRHAGIEYGYIIEGELTLKLDFDTFILKAGDSLSFDSLRPHLYVNHTTKPAKGLWMVLGRHDRDANASLTRGAHAQGPARSATDVLAAMRDLH